jgi:(E)-4-hydroxy-3-methyl-but-2-enyl pyrophosphate reductase (IPP and DMAPP forming)
LKVILANPSGFCFGVERAVNSVYEQIKINKDKIVYTYGPIIHNEEVIKDLKGKGVKILNTEEELKAINEGIVIIRSHGVSKKIYEIIEHKSNVKMVDATCPYVRKIHKLVEKHSNEDARVIIVGNGKHPEVIGIKGWGNKNTIIVEKEEDIVKIGEDLDKKVYIVAQTTFNHNKFQDLVEKIRKKRYDIIVLNTICNATQERQIEVKKIASQVEVMLVIGDKHSSNTQKLYEICQKECNNTYYIQTLGDFNPEWVSSVRSIGITAGASTPNNIIEEVHTKCQN